MVWSVLTPPPPRMPLCCSWLKGSLVQQQPPGCSLKWHQAQAWQALEGSELWLSLRCLGPLSFSLGLLAAVPALPLGTLPRVPQADGCRVGRALALGRGWSVPLPPGSLDRRRPCLPKGLQACQLALSSRTVWARCPNGDLARRYGVTDKNPAGDYWKKVPGSVTCLAGRCWGSGLRGGAPRGVLSCLGPRPQGCPRLLPCTQPPCRNPPQGRT